MFLELMVARATAGGVIAEPVCLGTPDECAITTMTSDQTDVGQIVCGELVGTIEPEALEGSGLAWANDGWWPSYQDYAVDLTQSWMWTPETANAGNLQGCTGEDGSASSASQLQVNPYSMESFVDIAVASCGESFAHAYADIHFTATTPWSLQCTYYYQPGIGLPVSPGLVRVVSNFGGPVPMIIEHTGAGVNPNVYLQTGYQGGAIPGQLSELNYFVEFELTGEPGPQHLFFEQVMGRPDIFDLDADGIFASPDLTLQAGPDGLDFNADGTVTWADLDVMETVHDAGLRQVCPDFPADGTINVGDLLNVINHWGVVPAGSPADFDENGFVDVSDLLLVIDLWGQTFSCGI